ncbi:MAG: DUF3231 family protein [Ruminiclostridium sp.]|nr:DUF3231 family protein [Ruminiclostridium sp.]
MNKVFKLILPKSYTLDTMEKPMHAGEIYYLWEALTAGYQVITIIESYMMNTEDKKLHLLLQGITNGVRLLRTNKLEQLLKDAGFTVPPRPASKILQGKPAVGQEVKLSDEEVIRLTFNVASSLLFMDGRGLGTITTKKNLRDVFIGFLDDDIKVYELLFNLGKERNVFDTPPPATSAPNSLNITELHWLWFTMDFRHSSILELETFMNNTKDQGTLLEIQHGLYNVALKQIAETEDILKREGFTVPPRPVDRTAQQPEGEIGAVRLSDSEIAKVLISACQLAINNHIRAFAGADRDDIKKLFKLYIQTEIDNLERLYKLAINRNLIEKPPFVSSKRG